MYSSTLSLTSALGGDGWSTPHLAAVPLGQTRYHLNRRLGGPQDRSGWVWNIPPPLGFDPQTCPSHSKSLYQLCCTEVLIKTQKFEFNF